MNESPENNNPPTNRRDERLGRVLSSVMLDMDAGGCPPLEDIAAYIDGRLGAEEKDHLMSHLAACRRCCDTLLAVRTVARQTKTASRRRIWSAAAAAIAVAALLVLTIRISLWHPVEERPIVARQDPPAVQPAPPAAPAIAEAPAAPPPPAMVAKAPAATPTPGATPSEAVAMARQLAGRAPAPEAEAAGGLGFAADERPEAIAFRLGAAALDLEIALIQGDRKSVLRQTARAESLLQAFGEQGETVTRLAGFRREIAAGRGAESAVGVSSWLAQAAIERGVLPFWRLGAWAQGAALAHETGNAEFFTAFPIRSGDLPAEEAEARRLLDEIAATLGAAPSADQAMVLQAKIEELLRLY